MTPRSRHLLVAALVAIPFIAFSGPTAGHNGRDRGKASASAPAAPVGVNTTHGITVTTDPKTGVRTYTQTGAVAPNPALAKTSAVRGSGGPGLDYWVRQSEGEGGSYAGPPGHTTSYVQPSSGHDENYDDSLAYSDYGYGGYLPAYGYGGGGGRPGHGGRPGRPGDGGGGGGQPADDSNGGYHLPPGSHYSPPPGPRGGGVGSPSPAAGDGIGAPPPQSLRYTSRGGGGRRR